MAATDSQQGGLSRRSFLAVMGGGALNAVAMTPNVPSAYPLIRAAGSHRELGRQHGEQAAEKIKSHVERIAGQERLSRDELRDRALAFRPLFDKYCPHLLTEIQGLSEGARIPLAEALAVNIRSALSLAPPEGCTSYVISRTGTRQHQILAGQNSDMDPGVPPLAYVLHLQPVNKPEVLIWTFGGMIGYHGMNSAGIAHFENSLFGDDPPDRWAMPYYAVKRMMLECDHVDQIVRLYQKIPIAFNANYVVCDGHGDILDIEATTAGPEVFKDTGAGFFAHSNHFLCPRYAQTRKFPPEWKDSYPRLTRMNSLIKSKFGAISMDDIKTFLRDHEGYPTSICRHNGESLTVASLIAEPSERCLHVAAGNPCSGQYNRYSM